MKVKFKAGNVGWSGTAGKGIWLVYGDRRAYIATAPNKAMAKVFAEMFNWLDRDQLVRLRDILTRALAAKAGKKE